MDNNLTATEQLTRQTKLATVFNTKTPQGVLNLSMMILGQELVNGGLITKEQLNAPMSTAYNKAVAVLLGKAEIKVAELTQVAVDAAPSEAITNG